MTTTQENTFAKFEIGSVYEMSFAGDSDLRPQYTCIARTEKTAKFESMRKEVISRKIRSDRNGEYIFDGNYSMAPCICAKRKVQS